MGEIVRVKGICDECMESRERGKKQTRYGKEHDRDLRDAGPDEGKRKREKQGRHGGIVKEIHPCLLQAG